jgi:hypothetical protein|uniref:Uncharacterized protein n=1 Tax=Fadolivirus 2 TaxID=2740747 RepID=A0A7D3UWJ8_9VIRU|nr:hypothetical protein Fadolivirus_2_3 [Fadolivirus 2]
MIINDIKKLKIESLSILNILASYYSKFIENQMEEHVQEIITILYPSPRLSPANLGISKALAIYIIKNHPYIVRDFPQIHVDNYNVKLGNFTG